MLLYNSRLWCLHPWPCPYMLAPHCIKSPDPKYSRCERRRWLSCHHWWGYFSMAQMAISKYVNKKKYVVSNKHNFFSIFTFDHKWNALIIQIMLKLKIKLNYWEFKWFQVWIYNVYIFFLLLSLKGIFWD